MQGKSKIKQIIITLIILALFPISAYLTSFLGSRKYYVSAILVTLTSLILFFVSFEGRKPRADEITTLSVLIAISVISRAVFIALPFIKPLSAMVIITAVAFGSQAGFLCGSVSILISNFIFGQGPWTAPQMLSIGLLGYISGLIFANRPKIQRPLYLCSFAVLVQLIIVGPLLDLSGVLFTLSGAEVSSTAALLIAGLPVNLLQGAVTAVFLLILFKPMTEKLERIKTKYGMMNYEV